MIMNVPSPISDIKRERRALRKREMILNQQIKNDKAILRNQTDPNICTRMQVGITTNEEERHQNHTRLAEIAEELSQLEDAEAGEDGTLSVSALLQLKSYGINDEMTIYLFSSRYKSDRKNYPEKKFPPLKDLAHVEAVLAAWAATDDNTVWLTDETWDNFLDRFRSMKTLKSVKDGFQKHYETMYVGSDVWLSRTTSALMNFAATKAKATDVPAAVTYMNAPVVIAYCQYVLGATEGEHDPYVDFEKKYWEAEAASNQGKSPYFVHVVCASGDEPGAKEPQTAYWFGGVPPADALAVWNAAIAKTVPSWAALSGHVRLGAAPFGCVKEPGLPFNTGHDVLMQAVASALRFIKYFVLNPQLTDTSKDDQISHFAFKQVLVWLGGLGFDALRLAFRALAEAEIEGADYYVSLTDDELTKVLLSIASENSSPSSGFGVLRPDFSDYVSCVVETGLVPRWLGAVLLLTLFKYASIEIDHTGDRALIHIDYQDRKAMISIPKDFFYQPLSEGMKTSGLAPVRDGLIRHLGLQAFFPDDMDATKARMDGLLADIFEVVRPADFPVRVPITANPFIIVPPSPQCKGQLSRHEQRPYFNVSRSYQIIRFNPKGGLLFDDVSTPAETLRYIWPRESYNVVAEAAFRQSLPDRVEPKKFSESASAYLKNFDDLGHIIGMLQSLDVLIGADLVKQVFPDAPVVLQAASRETPIVYFTPSDASDPDLMTNQGKTRAALAIGGTANLKLVSTPSKTDDSAPAQRTLVTAFHDCDHTLFADDLREITNPNHMLHENNLRTIATEGRGASAGLAGKNAKVLVFRHFLLITAKYVPQVSPDVLNRSFIYYLHKLTPENRLSSKDFTYFSSMKFRVTARLNYLAWMFTSGFSQIVYQIQPRVSSLRYDGHNGIAGALLGNGKELHADLSDFEAYITKAQGPKCKAQYAQATDSGVVEYTSGRTVVDPLVYFVVASAYTMQSIAREIRSAVGIGKMEMWKLLIMNTEVNDYCRVANTEGFTKIGIKKLGRQLFDAAKSGALVRDDGWRAIVKSITMSSGARNEHILLVNNQIPEFSAAAWDTTLSLWAKAHAKKGEPAP